MWSESENENKIESNCSEHECKSEYKLRKRVNESTI